VLELLEFCFFLPFEFASKTHFLFLTCGDPNPSPIQLWTTMKSRETHRISLTEARKILNGSGNQFTDDEINKIVNYLYRLADIEAQTLKTK
jgi:hypothetical protein